MGGWYYADEGHAKKRDRIRTEGRNTGTRTDLLTRGTSSISQPLRGGMEEAERYETCSRNLPTAAATLGMGAERPARGENAANSRIQRAVSMRPTLTFFFPAAYTSSTRRVSCTRGAHAAT